MNSAAVPAGLAPPPPAALAVAATLKNAGHEAWFVGGGVRDRLLGRPVNDWDVATDAEPEAVMACFPRAIPTGLQHGTVTVVSDHLPVEVTTFRVERGYTDGRRPDEVRYTRLLQDDLSRRDFTVNAMAWDPLADALLDPFDGRGDLARGVLRAVGRAVDRFGEDGLRALRAVRFASVLGLRLDPETEAAIPATLETFRKVSAERVRVEFTKTLLSTRPAWGLAALARTGLLAEFLPEATKLPSPLFARVVEALDAAENNLIVRLALTLWPAETDGDAVLRRLKYSTAERLGVVQVLRHRDFDPATPRSDADVRRFVANVGLDALDAVLQCGARWAATESEAAAKRWREWAERIDTLDARRAPLHSRDLALDGRAVMAALDLPPSRRIGRILDALLARVFVDPQLNTPAGLRALLPEVAASVDAPEAT